MRQSKDHRFEDLRLGKCLITPIFFQIYLLYMNFIVTEVMPMILILVMCVRIHWITSNDDDVDDANANEVNESAFPDSGVGQVSSQETTSTKIFLSFSAIFLVSNLPNCCIEVLDLFEADFQVKINFR